jgi:hypothetical protein
MWESYIQSSKKGMVQQAKNETYVYPHFVLDFEEKLKELKMMREDYYGDDAVSMSTIERRSDLSLEEFWDLYDAKW